MISFPWKWDFHGTVTPIPVLPIGVIILLYESKLKGNTWRKGDRIFAWSGFICSFIFVITSLLSVPVQQTIYPNDKISTYIANPENASIVRTYTSADKQTLNNTYIKDYMEHMEQESIESEQWYGNAVRNKDDERLPYQLTGITPKWGSGEVAIIYVEKDGKGLLVTTAKHQYYFRTDNSMFQEGTHS